MWLPGWGRSSPAFDVHLVPVAQFFAADLRQTVYRVHYVAHRERAAGMYAVVELPHGYFPVEQRARMEPLSSGSSSLVPGFSYQSYSIAISIGFSAFNVFASSLGSVFL